MVKLYRGKKPHKPGDSSLHFMLILFFQQLKGGLSQGQNHLKDSSFEFQKLLGIIQGAFQFYFNKTISLPYTTLE